MSSARRWFVLASLILITLGLAAACGSSHHKASVNCRFAPKGSIHALAAKEGLACPSALPKAVRGSVRSTGLQEMDDSTELGALLGTNYPAYAGYTDGLYQSYRDIYGYFHPRGKQTVGIDVDGGNARSTDLEPSPGNFQNNPYSAGPWARGQINNTSNKRPVIYTMGSWQSAIEDSLAHVSPPVPRCSTPTQQGCYLEWMAVWDGQPILYAHMTAKQFINHGPNGENRDRSVYDPTMLFPPPPPPPNVMHYEYYSTTSVPNPWHQQNLSEYRLVFNYDWYRAYPTAYAKQLSNLEIKLTWWAQQLAYRIHHSPTSVNYADRRYSRYGNDVARGLHHKRCFSFTGCEYGVHK